MILWGGVTWKTLANVPMNLLWNNPSAQWNYESTRPDSFLFANL